MIRGSGLGALNHVPGDAIDPQNIIASEPIPDFTSGFSGIADIEGRADGFLSVENDPKPT
jgi:hypothetical protein